MRLTRQTNYAIRMMMYCATDPADLSRVPAIAKAYGVSDLFLFKILHVLVDAGLMTTVRGRKGGVKLARPAQAITLADVVRVTEDNFQMAECFGPDTADCPLIDACALNVALHKALNAFFDVLVAHTIADLVRDRARIGPALGLDPAA